ncbi:MAG: mechanosensitive ion channel family protein [Pseudobacter sp.]|uniref:mechanosensitive ion channel family protein n=1 Tax=Pseudobacter sp. TaxID=2045420 RepID=UPI003F8197A9
MRTRSSILISLFVFICMLCSVNRTIAQQQHFLSDSVMNLLRQAAGQDYHKSQDKYSAGRMAARQEALINDLKSTLLKAKVFITRGLDTNAINTDLDNIQRWYDTGCDGIFQHKGSLQSHRNLTSTNILFKELLKKIDTRKQAVDKYQHELSGFRMHLDSLGTDSALYYISNDSAALMQFLSKIMVVRQEINPTDSILEQAIQHVRGLQNRINLMESTVSTALDEIEHYHKDLDRNFFSRETHNIWEGVTSYRPIREIIYYSALKGQLALWFYVQNHWGRMLLLLVLVIASTVFISSLKRKVKAEGLLQQHYQGQLVLRYPVLSAILIVVSVFQFIFPSPPALFTTILGVTAAIALTIIFKGFITRHWMFIWLTMFVQFLIACGDNLILQGSRIERYFMLLFSLVGVITGLLILLKGRRSELREKAILWFIAFVVVLELAAIFFNMYGRYNYAKTMYVSGFINVIIAITFLWVVRLVNETLLLASEVYKRPERNSFFINFERVGRKAPAVFYIFLVVGWFIIFGRNFYAFHRIADPIQDFLFAERSIGQYNFSIKGMLLFFGILFISTFVSRIVSFFATDKVPVHSSSTGQKKIGLGSWILLIRIAIISIGLFLAVAAAGIPLDRFTIILGALGVGVGLGLQALVSNLVSGLILAFEKPVNVGDIIEVAGKTGTIKSIGFRSSELTSIDGSTVIIPNGDLLNEHLVNWSQGRGFRRIELVVGVSYDTNIDEVLPQLNELLKANQRLLSSPPPVAFADKFNDSTIDLKLLFWISNPREFMHAKSEVMSDVQALFNKNGIKIPFPQRDIHIVTTDKPE